MTKVLRPLSKSDYNMYKSIQTDLEDDYMLNIFPALTDGESRLFGLFVDEQLISTAGYTVFANHFVMLGRLRSDIRFRGQNFGTEILEYAKNQALEIQGVEFVGANTEQHNKPSQKVLKKLGLSPVVSLYGAQTQDLSSLLTENAKSWLPLTDSGRKREWLNRTYLNDDFPEKIFPFAAYYPFPASESLFKEETLQSWNFFENKKQSRFLILWEEDKGGHYLHVTYPWDDFMEQPGFWETIDIAYQQAKKNNPDTTIWIDLSEPKASLLPDAHPFVLSSPWMLHGIYADYEETSTVDLSKELTEAQISLDQLESELVEIENDLNQKIDQTEELKHSLDELDT